MSETRLTEAQAKALSKLAPEECGWVHGTTAKALAARGLIERYGSTRLTDWWSITEAGRAMLAARTPTS